MRAMSCSAGLFLMSMLRVTGFSFSGVWRWCWADSSMTSLWPFTENHSTWNNKQNKTTVNTWAFNKEIWNFNTETIIVDLYNVQKSLHHSTFYLQFTIVRLTLSNSRWCLDSITEQELMWSCRSCRRTSTPHFWHFAFALTLNASSLSLKWNWGFKQQPSPGHCLHFGI